MIKKVIVILFAGIMLCLLANLVFADTEVGNAVPCKQVQYKEPVEPNDVFPADIGRVYFHTVLHTTEQPTFVIHEWYYKDQMISNVKLDVNFPRTRTWSYKTIQPNMIGDWKVRVIDAKGNLLKEGFFKILPVDMPESTTLPQQPLVPEKGVPLPTAKEQKIAVKPVAGEVYLLPRMNYEYYIKYGVMNMFGGIKFKIKTDIQIVDMGPSNSYGEHHFDSIIPGFEIGIKKNNRKLQLGGSFGYYYGREEDKGWVYNDHGQDVRIAYCKKTKVLQLNANADYLFRVFYLTSSFGLTSLAFDDYKEVIHDEGLVSFYSDSYHYSSTFPMLGLGIGWRMFPRYKYHPLIQLKYGTRLNGQTVSLSLLGGVSF